MIWLEIQLEKKRNRAQGKGSWLVSREKDEEKDFYMFSFGLDDSNFCIFCP